MADRITKSQLAGAFNRATYSGRGSGALRDGEWIGTAVAWSMSYVCVYDKDGAMVRSMSAPTSTRGLYDYARALADAFELVETVSVPRLVSNSRRSLTADGFTA
jgi:hypothetical protein